MALFLVLLLTSSPAFPQNNITDFSSYWKNRTELFRTLPNPENEICFLGDSITDGCEWAELIGICNVTNRGISGDTAWGVLARIDEVTEGKPWKVFLMIGTNDLARGKLLFEVRDKIAEVIDAIQKQSPQTEIYLQSVLPVIDGKNPAYKNENIFPLNTELSRLAAEKHVTWIDLAPWFKDQNGQLQEVLTEDGLHLNGRSYYLWFSLIRKFLP
jgi:lysophospholipase L1-like esterase